MKSLLILLTLISIVGCTTPRNKFTDYRFRAMIDPDSIESKHYVMVQHSIAKSKRFVLVDRGAGFSALKKEQSSYHRSSSDRYSDQEKWAHWGELYGVGAVIVASINCGMTQVWWSQYNQSKCVQSLSMIDSSTGEVVATAETQTVQSAYDQIPPSWDNAVESLVEDYPETFEPNTEHKNLKFYKEFSKEAAIREKEKNLLP